MIICIASVQDKYKIGGTLAYNKYCSYFNLREKGNIPPLN